MINLDTVIIRRFRNGRVLHTTRQSLFRILLIDCTWAAGCYEDDYLDFYRQRLEEMRSFYHEEAHVALRVIQGGA